jgi:NitT/TauT family transport system substrate-binding protein
VILRLQVDRDSKKREFRLRPDMVKKANMLMRSNGMLKRDITYQELLDR